MKEFKFIEWLFHFCLVLIIDNCFLLGNLAASEVVYESNYELFNQLNLSDHERQLIQKLQGKEKQQIASYENEIKHLQAKLNTLVNLDDSVENNLDREINQLKSLIESDQSMVSNIKTKTWRQIRENLSQENRELLYKIQFQNH